jgi:transposase
MGSLPVLYALLEILRVREIINHYCPSKAKVDNGAVGMVMILNRLVAPRALYKIADWVAQSVLVQTLGVPGEKFNDDRLGRTLDAIAQHKREIWQAIVNEALGRFDIDLSFIFYDLTAFVMQGEYTDSDLVDYGFAHNTPSGKQKVKLAASAASDGNVPVDYEATSGRTADIATVQENMERLSRLLRRHGYALDQVVIIGDRGTLNDEIALKYDAKGLRYLAGLKTQKKAHRELLRAVPEKQFYNHRLTDEHKPKATYGLPCQVTFKHEGKTVTHRGLVVIAGPMRFTVRKGRARKLRALRAELAEVQAKIGRPHYRSVKAVQARADTRLRNSPVGKLMCAQAYLTEDGRVDLRWWLDRHTLWQAMHTDGRYLLVTNDFTLAPQQMIELYRAKDGVEKCFRISKQELKVRPIYVHSDARIEALLLVNMLALLVYRLLEREMHNKGLPLSTRRLIEQLENLTVIETYCWDASVLYRLTPASEEQRLLIAFLSHIVTELRLFRARPELDGSGLLALPSPLGGLLGSQS